MKISVFVLITLTSFLVILPYRVDAIRCISCSSYNPACRNTISDLSKVSTEPCSGPCFTKLQDGSKIKCYSNKFKKYISKIL